MEGVWEQAGSSAGKKQCGNGLNENTRTKLKTKSQVPKTTHVGTEVFKWQYL